MIVEHDVAAGRFVARLAGGDAFTAYRPVSDSVVEFYSTYVPPPERGKNVASRLVAAALAYARDHHLKVIPSCWYVAGWIERHGFSDLLSIDSEEDRT
jgi:predicted GNAT family acetyltransferase